MKLSTHPVCFRGDCKTLATKQSADVIGFHLGSLQDKKLLAGVTLE